MKNKLNVDIEQALKQYKYKNYKNAIYVIVKYCVDEVGTNFAKLEDKILSMTNIEEINNIVNTSLLYKQILKSFICLSNENKMTLLVEAVKCLKEENCNSVKSFRPEIKMSDYKTNVENIILRLPSNYNKMATGDFDFYAVHNDINIIAKIKQYKKEIEYGNVEPVYEEKMEMKFLDKLCEYVQNKDVTVKQIKEYETFNRNDYAINGLGFEHYRNKKMVSTELIGKEKFYKISVIKLTGEDIYNYVFLIGFIQYCDLNNKNNYTELIEDNIMKSIRYESSKEKFDEINDDYLGKIKLKLFEDNVSIINIKNVDKLFIDVDISIDFKEDGYKNYDEFKDNINGYIETLKNIFRSKEQIIESLYSFAKKIYISWEIKPDVNSISDEYVKNKTKIFSIILHNDSAIITADLMDDANEELGGHQFELLFKNGSKNDWNLVG